jgi:hypothetical protein
MRWHGRRDLLVSTRPESDEPRTAGLLAMSCDDSVVRPLLDLEGCGSGAQVGPAVFGPLRTAVDGTGFYDSLITATAGVYRP